MKLLFHIGAGKTGTSSVQDTLRTHLEALKAQGVWYLGQMLEHAPVVRFAWQRTAGSEALLALHANARRDQVISVLSESIDALVASGCREAIWSNEWFFRGAIPEMIAAMQAMDAKGIDVRIVAYVRRHDAWARSAYVQWGIKHKTYRGPLMPFAGWSAANDHGFAKSLTPWREAFGERFLVRNYDAVPDVTADFFQVAGIDATAFEAVRKNESPPAEELFLRAVFNGQAAEVRRPAEFDRAMPALRKARVSGAPSEVLGHLMPDAAALAAVARDYEADRTATDALLAQSGQPPLHMDPLPERKNDVDLGALTTLLAQVVADQARRLLQLERRIDRQDKPPVDEAVSASVAEGAPNKAASWGTLVAGPARRDDPVFLLSTGRTGSTLMQRLLNCHADLVVWGEHHGFLGGFAASFADMSGQRRRLVPPTPADNFAPQQLLPTLSDPAAPLEWANPWSSSEYEDRIRGFVADYFGGRLAGGQRWGFKEILYNRADVLSMLHRLFPHGRFVFMTRDPCEVVRSKILAFEKRRKWDSRSAGDQDHRIGELLAQVENHYRTCRDFEQLAPEASLTVSYEHLVAAPRLVLADVLRLCGLAESGFDWALADQVLASNIGATDRDDALLERIRAIAAARPGSAT